MKTLIKGLLAFLIVVGFSGGLLYAMKKGYFGEIDTSLDISDPYTRGGFEVVNDGYLLDYWGDDDEIILPPTIKTISTNAFKGNKDIISIVIPETIEKIEPEAFSNCTKLEKVIIHANISELSYKTFYYCKSLTEIQLHDSIKKIGYSAFEGCQKLTNIILPKKLEYIGGKAFNKCNLNTLIIPKTLTSVGKKGNKGPFSNSHATNIQLEEGMTKIPKNMFIRSDMKEIHIPSSITEIADSAFLECESLQKVTMEEGITKIGKYAFKDCKALETIELPSTLTSCSNTMIKNCDDVTFIVKEDSYAHQFVLKNQFSYQLK